MPSIAEPFRTSEIAKLEIHQLDSKFSRKFTNTKTKNPGGGTRSEIRELSRQSRTRLIYKARNIPGLQSMVTFTYPHETYAETALGGNYMFDGQAVKNHLRKLRQWFTYRGIYGFWFLEFQKRGAPHFHFITSKPLTEKEVQKLKNTWSRMVGTPCQHHPERGVKHEILRKKHAAGAYAAKYSSKSEQKTVPDRYKNVGRFWGLFGPVPEEKTVLKVTMRDMYKLIRIARAAEKAHLRQYRKKKRKNRDRGDGYSGVTLYNSGHGMVGIVVIHLIPVVEVQRQYVPSSEATMSQVAEHLEPVKMAVHLKDTLTGKTTPVMPVDNNSYLQAAAVPTRNRQHMR